MKKLVLLAAIGTMALGACGGGKDKGGGPAIVDGGPVIDGAGAVPDVCNPVTQDGCEAGEKCARLIIRDVEGMPFLGQIACVADGTVAEGQTCAPGEQGQETGFDNCVAGYDCFQGVCTSICGGNPDSCRTGDQAFGTGDTCAVNFVDHFNTDIGVCLAACDPTNDTITVVGDEDEDDVAVNAACGEGSSCGFNPFTNATSCSGTPTMSATQTQAETPFGPPSGGIFSNGCASGFSAGLVQRDIGNPFEGPQCARWCTPVDTYLDAQGVVQGSPFGANDKCSEELLGALGGDTIGSNPNMCRFVQQLAIQDIGGAEVSVGVCSSVNSMGGGPLTLGSGATGPEGLRGDCRTFEFDGLAAAWNAAAPNGVDAANAAFLEFCVSDPADPMNASINLNCIGQFASCLSIEFENSKLDEPVGTATARGKSVLDGIHAQVLAMPGVQTQLKNL